MRFRRTARGELATSPEGWHTALQAAYFIGDQGADAFAWAAGSTSAALRRTVSYSLYLWWRTDPDFVYGVLWDLARRVGTVPMGRTARMLRTLSDASILIYINHPERNDVIEQTSALWSEILKGRLRLHRRRWLDALVFVLLSSLLSRRVLETALLGQPPSTFFSASTDLQDCFRRTVPLADPTTSLSDAQRDLAGLLESPVRLHSVLAALVIAVHAAADFAATEPLIRQLFKSLNGPGRVWAVQAFSVLLPDTPRAWVGLLEELTAALIEADRATLLPRQGRWDAEMDLTLLPLGLAYGKTGGAMPYVERLLTKLVAEADTPLICCIVEGLGAVGFHHPELVFRALRPVVPSLIASDATRGALIRTLATMRTVRFDEVDIFLREQRADLPLRRAVAAATDPQRVHRLISWVGLYNNAVHQALRYPIMREELLLSGLRELGRARSARRFVWSYTWPALRLLRRYDYELIRWTGREPTSRDRAT